MKLIDHINMNHRQVFDQICENLQTGRAFTYSRFGDGEFNAILGKTGANCDGHTYFPDMGRELADILRSRPPYMVGLHHGAKEPLATETLNWLNDNDSILRFVWSGIFHDALKHGWMPDFFQALEGRKVCIVGPPHLRSIENRIKYNEFIEVPPKDCWTSTDIIMGDVDEWIEPDANQVILFCASMAANVWIHRLWKMYGDSVTLIDLGSGIDPYCGVKQRSYHHKAKL